MAEWKAISDNMHTKIESITTISKAAKIYFKDLNIDSEDKERLCKAASQVRNFAEEGRIWARLSTPLFYSNDFSSISNHLKIAETGLRCCADKIKNLKLEILNLPTKMDEKQIIPVESSGDFFALTAKRKESLEQQNAEASKYNENLAKQITALKEMHAAITTEYKTLMPQELNRFYLQSNTIEMSFQKHMRKI